MLEGNAYFGVIIFISSEYSNLNCKYNSYIYHHHHHHHHHSCCCDKIGQEVDRACSMHGRDEKLMQSFSQKTQREETTQKT